MSCPLDSRVYICSPQFLHLSHPSLLSFHNHIIKYAIKFILCRWTPSQLLTTTQKANLEGLHELAIHVIHPGGWKCKNYHLSGEHHTVFSPLAEASQTNVWRVRCSLLDVCMCGKELCQCDDIIVLLDVSTCQISRRGKLSHQRPTEYQAVRFLWIVVFSFVEEQKNPVLTTVNTFQWVTPPTNAWRRRDKKSRRVPWPWRALKLWKSLRIIRNDSTPCYFKPRHLYTQLSVF